LANPPQARLTSMLDPIDGKTSRLILLCTYHAKTPDALEKIGRIALISAKIQNLR